MTCQSDTRSFGCWILSHFIWSHRIAASLWNCSLHPSLYHPIPSQLISSHAFSAFFTPSHLIPSNVFSPFIIFTQLITTVLFSSHVTWAFLISSQCISDFHSPLTLLSSPQLMSAHLVSSHLFSKSSPSFKLFSHSSCQLVSPHLSSSQRTLKSSQLFSGPKPAPKTDPGAKASDPCAFHREDFTQRSLYTAFTRSHREAPTQKRFYPEKLLHTASFYKENILHTASFYREQILHTEAFTEKLLHREAFTHRSCYPRKLLHMEAFTHRSFYTHTQAFSHNGARNCSSKTGSRRHSPKKECFWITF